MSQLPVQPPWRLADCPEQRRWLVEGLWWGLWSEQAVGIIGAEPKCCKSFLALGENGSGDLLAFLRELQRRHAIATSISAETVTIASS